MSLFGSLDTAVGGISAQSTALSNISDNIANSQTVGFKETDTSFTDYVTQASSTAKSPNLVVAQPKYTNTLQGNITQVTNPTSLAISGAGFFAVQLPSGVSSTGSTTLNPDQYYTRVGDFSLNTNGNFVNSTGYVLDGKNGAVQISQAPSLPVPTANVTVAANLPSTPSTDTVTTPYTSNLQVYDAQGNAQNLTLSWSQVGSVTPNAAISATNPAVPNQWNLTITGGTTTNRPLLVNFGATAANAGTITSIADTANAADPAVPSAQATGDAATLTLPLNFGLGTQNVSLNLGTFGGSNGVTQFAGSSYQVATQTQDGSPQGNFSSVSIRASGDVVINYSNGSNKTVDTIPLVTFNNPDGLAQQDGQAFTATKDSGPANAAAAGTGKSGTLVVGADEASNVDIATQFTQMIVAQQAYTANTKIITTANTLLQATLNMVQG